MKTVKYLLSAIMLAGSLSMSAQSAAVTVSDIEKVLEDDELPVVGVRYYYYPNLDAYFDTHTNLYIYQQNGTWTKSQQMAPGYRGYSVMNNIRVEVTDYNGDQPYTKLTDHQRQFPKNYSAKRKPPKLNKEEPKIAFK